MAEERIAVVTGASSGIGELLVLRLAREGWRVAVINRSATRSAHLLESLETSGASVTLIEADLADQNALADAAERILGSFPRVDALFNNAGVMLPSLQWSPQGNELHAEVNWLAPYQLMRRLRPLLKAGRGIAINTSSQALRFGGRPRPRELLHPPVGRGMGLFGAYARSKLALTTTVRGMAGDYAADGIRLVSLHLGVLATAMTHGKGMPGWLRLLGPLTYDTPEKGAERLHDALTPPEAEGAFLVNGKPARLPAYARDPERQKALLEACRDATGL